MSREEVTSGETVPNTVIVLLDGSGKIKDHSPGWEEFLRLCGTGGRDRLLRLLKQISTSEVTTHPTLSFENNVSGKSYTFMVNLLPLGSDASTRVLMLQEIDPASQTDLVWQRSEIPLLGIDAAGIVGKVTSGVTDLMGLTAGELMGKPIMEIFDGWDMAYLLNVLESDHVYDRKEEVVLRRVGEGENQWTARYLGQDAAGFSTFIITHIEEIPQIAGSHQGRIMGISQHMDKIRDATSSIDMLHQLCDLAHRMMGGEAVAIWVNPQYPPRNLIFSPEIKPKEKEYFQNYVCSSGFIKYASSLIPYQFVNPSNDDKFKMEVLPLEALEQTLGFLLIQPREESSVENRAMRFNMVRLALRLNATMLYHALEVEKLRRDYKTQISILEFTARIAPLVEIDQLMKEVARFLSEEFGYQNIIIGQVDPLDGVIRSPNIYTQKQLTEEQKVLPMGIMAWVVQSEELLNVADTRRDERYVDGISGTRSELAVPIKAGRGKIVGVIDVQSDQIGTFSHYDEELLESVAIQVSSAMQNAQSFALVNQNFEDAKNLLSIHTDITNQPYFEETLTSVCQGITTLLGSTAIIYIAHEKNHYQVEYVDGDTHLEIGKVVGIPTSLIPRVTQQPNPFEVGEKDKAKLAEKLALNQNKFIYIVPICFANQTLDGLVIAETEQAVPANTMNLMQILGSIASSALENKLLWERERLAMHNVAVMSHLSHLALDTQSLEKFIQVMVNFLGKEMNFSEVRFFTTFRDSTPRLVSRYQGISDEGLEKALLTELEKVIGETNLVNVEWSFGGKLYKIITIAMKDETVWGYLQAVKEITDYRMMADFNIPNLADILNSIRRRMMLMDQQASMLLELQNSQKMRSDFLAKVSHELRTPLTTILAYTDMLTSNVLGELTGEQDRATQSIEKSGRRLFQLINDLLDFSQMERSEDMSLDIRATEVLPIIEEAEGALRIQAREKGVKISFEIPGNLPKVMADGVRLTQIFTNLLSNAIKFTESGDDVIVRVHTKGEMMVCEVEDHGIGISPEDQKRIFGAFVQLEDPLHREHGGTGIGLAIAQNLVGMMGGEMSLLSEPGKGSVFSFTLPLA